MTQPNSGATGPLKPLNIRAKGVEVPAYESTGQNMPPAHVTEGASLTPVLSGPLVFPLGLDRLDSVHFGFPDMRADNLNLENLVLGDNEAENQASIALMLQKVDAAMAFVKQVEQSIEPLDKMLQQDLKLLHKELNQVETLMSQASNVEVEPSLPDSSGELV